LLGGGSGTPLMASHAAPRPFAASRVSVKMALSEPAAVAL
jgi:hypothetical protein